MALNNSPEIPVNVFLGALIPRAGAFDFRRVSDARRPAIGEPNALNLAPLPFPVDRRESRLVNGRRPAWSRRAG